VLLQWAVQLAVVGSAIVSAAIVGAAIVGAAIVGAAIVGATIFNAAIVGVQKSQVDFDCHFLKIVNTDIIFALEQ